MQVRIKSFARRPRPFTEPEAADNEELVNEDRCRRSLIQELTAVPGITKVVIHFEGDGRVEYEKVGI